MSSFKDIRDFLFPGYAHDMFNDEEFCLLHDFYQSRNPDFPYSSYASFDLEEMDAAECYNEFPESINGTFPCWQIGFIFHQHSNAHSVPFAME